MTTRIPLIAAALLTGLAVGYNFNKPFSHEIRRAIAVTGTEPEVRKAIPVEAEVRRAIPVKQEVRKAIPVHNDQQPPPQIIIVNPSATEIADEVADELESRQQEAAMWAQFYHHEPETVPQPVTHRVEPLPDDEEPSHSFTSYLFTTPNGDSIIGTTSQIGNFGFHHFSTSDGDSINGTSTRIGNTVFHNFTGSNGQIGNGTTTEW
jgi:hypothetical protein